MTNSNAPFIYVDGVGAYGITRGIAHVALEVARHTVTDGGKLAVSDAVTVAHLRLPPHAVMALKKALDGIDLIIKTPPNPAKN